MDSNQTDTTRLPGAPSFRASLLPLSLFVIAFLITLIIVLCTDIRLCFCDKAGIQPLVTFGVILFGFIIALTVNKFDIVSTEVNKFGEKIGYLQILALKYNPVAICYLIESLKVYRSIDYVLQNQNSQYALYNFQAAVFPFIPAENKYDIEQLSNVVNSANVLLNDRINPTNFVSNELWYLLLFGLTVLTLILPLNSILCRVEAVLATLLVWIPAIVVYYLYYSRQCYVKIVTTLAIQEFTVPGLQCNGGTGTYNPSASQNGPKGENKLKKF